MEKYRSSADPSTGIHPFLPPKAALNLHAKPLILLRLPVLIISLVFYFPLSLLSALLPFKFLSYWAHRIVDMLFLPIFLFCFSAWRVPAPVYERPRTRIGKDEKDKSKKTKTSPYPRRGDLIVCNHTSPLDILYLQRFYSPIFAVPTYQLPSVKNPNSLSPLVVPVSIFSALQRVSCAPKPVSHSHPSATRLSDLCRTGGRPVVFLAEGCATNGMGVLQFALPFDALPGPSEAPNVFALGLSYSAGRCEARPGVKESSFWMSLLYFMTLPSAHVKGRVAAIVPTDMKHLQKTVATLAGGAALSVGYETGLKFAQHWAKTH